MRFPLKAQYRLAVLSGLVLLAFLPAILILTLPGCASKGFDPAGPYATNAFLGRMDIALAESKTALTDFVSWEYTNHAELVKSKPGLAIARSANAVREYAPIYFTNVWLLRSNYLWAFGNDPQNSGVASNSFYGGIQTLKALAVSTGPLTNGLK